jgi:hypothetical protein
MRPTVVVDESEETRVAEIEPQDVGGFVGGHPWTKGATRLFEAVSRTYLVPATQPNRSRTARVAAPYSARPEPSQAEYAGSGFRDFLDVTIRRDNAPPDTASGVSPL